MINLSKLFILFMWNPHGWQSTPVLGSCDICISSLDIDDIDSFAFCQASCVLHLNNMMLNSRARCNDSQACLPAGLNVGLVKEKYSKV